MSEEKMKKENRMFVKPSSYLAARDHYFTSLVHITLLNSILLFYKYHITIVCQYSNDCIHRHFDTNMANTPLGIDKP